MKKIFAMLLAVVMMFCLLCSCGTPNEAANNSAGETEEAVNEVETAVEEVEETEDTPWVVTVGCTSELGDFLYGSGSTFSYMAGNLVYDFLFTYNRESKQDESDVLEDWYYEDDTTFVMVMKEGITFSDGSAMTPDDIVFSLRSYVDNPSNTYASYTSFIEFDKTVIEGNTITLKFAAPTSSGLFGLRFPIYQQKWAQEHGWENSEWATDPMGSGPYVVTEYVTDNYMILDKREDYWGDASDLPDQFKMICYSEVSTEYIDLETGALDLAVNISPEDYARALQTDGIEAMNVYSGANLFFALNQTTNEYLQDKAVREAICRGVDWNAAAVLARGDYGEMPSSIINSQSQYYKEIGTYTYDPDYARQVLEDAGYSAGEITLKYIGPEMESQKKMAEAIQYYLSEIGITLEIEFADITTCVPAWLNGDCDAMFNTNGAGSPNADPVSYLSDYTDAGAFQSARVNDATFNEMFTAAASCTDQETDKELWSELAQYSYDNFLLINVYEVLAPVAYDSTAISGGSFSSGNTPNLRQIEYVQP